MKVEGRSRFCVQMVAEKTCPLCLSNSWKQPEFAMSRQYPKPLNKTVWWKEWTKPVLKAWGLCLQTQSYLTNSGLRLFPQLCIWGTVAPQRQSKEWLHLKPGTRRSHQCPTFVCLVAKPTHMFQRMKGENWIARQGCVFFLDMKSRQRDTDCQERIFFSHDVSFNEEERGILSVIRKNQEEISILSWISQIEKMCLRLTLNLLLTYNLQFHLL